MWARARHPPVTSPEHFDNCRSRPTLGPLTGLWGWGFLLRCGSGRGLTYDCDCWLPSVCTPREWRGGRRRVWRRRITGTLSGKLMAEGAMGEFGGKLGNFSFGFSVEKN